MFSQISSGKTPGLFDEKVMSKKFQSAYAEAFGAMPSDKDLNDGLTPGENFRLGMTGVTLQIDIQTPKPRPRPKNISIRSSSSQKRVAIRWEASGENLGEIDHCLVFIEYRGQRILLGTVPCSGLNNRFYFRDFEYAAQVGEKKYYVKFVYTDFKISQKSASVSHIVHTSLPPAYLEVAAAIEVRGVVATKQQSDSYEGIKLSDIPKSSQTNNSGKIIIY